MMLKLYNTLTRDKDEFVPLDESCVRMYVCGPTVYDHAHIGNARPVVVFDLLFRLLRHIYGSDSVVYVRNITDVDDKINARALRDYPDLPLNDAILSVTEKPILDFCSDMDSLGCLPPTHEPRATDFVLPRSDNKTDMVTMINALLSKDHAYIASGAHGREILFRVSSLSSYGSLSRRDLDSRQAGARIEVEAHKESPHDFVLWKESFSSEPGWDARFGGETIRGRPGWHIECSAMSSAYLSERFDIHGGGIDLIFPHHENELAQSCAVHGTDMMAQVWMHNGFLRVDNQKMSKSEGNFFTVRELLTTDSFGGRVWDGETVRLALLMTHYRDPLDFTARRLDEAHTLLQKYRRRCDGSGGGVISSDVISMLSDDLDMSGVMDVLSKLSGGDLRLTLNFLGFGLSSRDINFDPTSLIEERSRLLLEKDYASADKIRDDLLSRGIRLLDSKDSSGARITTWEVI